MNFALKSLSLQSNALPIIAVPAESFDVQAQNIGKPSNPKALRRPLFLFAIAAVIEFCFSQLFDGNETRKTIGNVAELLFLLAVLVDNFFVIFFGNVQ